jgi:hypothetical protein
MRRVSILLQVLALGVVSCDAPSAGRDADTALAALKASIDAAIVASNGTVRIPVRKGLDGSLVFAAPYAAREHASVLQGKFGQRAYEHMAGLQGVNQHFFLFLVDDDGVQGFASWADARFVFSGVIYTDSASITSLCAEVDDRVLRAVRINCSSANMDESVDP